MATTSSRMLRLLSLLQSQRSWPGPELADRLEVSVRTLRRDVDRLRDLGYPVQAARGVSGGYQLAAGASLPPLALDDDEAVALAVGLQAATTSMVAGMAEPSLRALAKVVQVMPPRLRRQVDALRVMTVTASWSAGTAGPAPQLLLAAAQACRAGEGLALGYSDAAGVRTERRVEPYRLVSLGRSWYLVAYDLDRQAWRSFRVDRVTAMAPDGRRFRHRELPADDAAAFVRQSIQSAPSNIEVSAVLGCTAEMARARLGSWAPLEDLPGDRCRITMTIDSLDRAASALGMVGAEVSEVSPPALAVVLGEWAERFARAGRARGSAPSSVIRSRRGSRSAPVRPSQR